MLPEVAANNCPFPHMNTTPIPSYNLVSATRSCLKRYIKFSGRACRSEFWFWTLATVLIGFIPAVADIAIYGQEAVANDKTPISDIYSLLILLPALGVMVRRFHDTGRSAWNLLWYLLPLIGWIIILVFCCKVSGPANEYGDGPATPEA